MGAMEASRTNICMIGGSSLCWVLPLPERKRGDVMDDDDL